MVSFPKSRVLLGTAALVIATGALLACTPQHASAAPGSQGRAGVNQGQAGVNQGQAGVNQGNNLDQGLIQAIDNVMGIIAQAQQMGMNIPGLDNAAQVWFRLVDVSTNNPRGGSVGPYGTSRVGNFTVYGGVQNIFNRLPPFQLFELDTYDAIGRQYTIGFKAKL